MESFYTQKHETESLLGIFSLCYNSSMSILSKSIFITLFSSIFFVSAHAQVNETSLRVSPEFVRPNSTVSIIAEGSSSDLSVATFTWYVNGKVFTKGRGVTSIQIPSGKTGVLTRVSADIGTSGGTLSSATSFRPADVSLVWKSDSYTPPFYKGGRLSTYESEFTVTAIPEFFNTSGARIDPKTLVYTWKKNDTIDPNQSGYGKDSYKGKQASFTRGEDKISVIVSTAADDMSAGQSVFIVPQTPEIVFYENNPLYGIIYERAISNSFFLTGEEITIHAVPFDISIPKMPSDLSLNWSINGFSVPEFSNKKEIVLRKSGQGSGQHTLGLNIQHASKLLQGGQNSITINQ